MSRKLMVVSACLAALMAAGCTAWEIVASAGVFVIELLSILDVL